ncbi:MAG: nucleotidyltransferase substrate binding protein [Chitinivibrionales bacterium]|nr:nucleotidyltransferase substrate binding protein [Chitinivibrionales bacterium]
MDTHSLDYSNLEKAVSSLETAITIYESQKENLGAHERDLMRDGVIQRFEYTFELAWKTMKRYLQIYGLEKIDTLSNRELFRVSFEYGLIDDAASWFDYLTDRNQTSHIYDQEIAGDVFISAQNFLADVQFLLNQLKERLR